ncbi:hypothetical protein Scep_017009 [Stephania cephalantha]|uniref:Uncharacterized protein n=1 Tax=Stephania cephalantha TaxID=152367 RepID=A0AAP0NWH4_9MAGN
MEHVFLEHCLKLPLTNPCYQLIHHLESLEERQQLTYHSCHQLMNKSVWSPRTSLLSPQLLDWIVVNDTINNHLFKHMRAFRMRNHLDDKTVIFKN